jgi:two-component system, response regulator PdtaR
LTSIAGETFRTPIPNAEIFLLENSSQQQLLKMFEYCLKTRSKTAEYGKLSGAWRLLFSDLYLSNIELEDEMESGVTRLSEENGRMLREFIKADCANGGAFVLNIIKTGGMIDRSALILIADLEDLAGVVTEGTTALHLLAKACDKGVRPALIKKAGKRLLSSVFDRNGIPIMFLIFGLSDLYKKDLDAMEVVFSKDDLRQVKVQNRLGRNALEIFTEIAGPIRSRAPRERNTFFNSSAIKTTNMEGSIREHTGTPHKNKRVTGKQAKKVTVYNKTLGKGSIPDTLVPHRPAIPDTPDKIDGMMKVMIVDDDEIIRNLLQLLVKKLGYDVCVMAENGDDAVKLAFETKPDLIFMDINMPGNLDGIAAAKEIKTRLDTRIIFVTGFCEEEMLDRTKGIQPEGYILKPFTGTDLDSKIKLLK